MGGRGFRVDVVLWRYVDVAAAERVYVGIRLGSARRKGQDVHVHDLESRKGAQEAGPRLGGYADGALVGADAGVDGERDAVARDVLQLVREHLLCGREEFLSTEED